MSRVQGQGVKKVHILAGVWVGCVLLSLYLVASDHEQIRDVLHAFLNVCTVCSKEGASGSEEGAFLKGLLRSAGDDCAGNGARVASDQGKDISLTGSLLQWSPGSQNETFGGKHS